ncbi:MAG: hypothetical protein RQ760_02475, partial [Sedimentisphaerales bacterium]|nr:hypothetical protein [Sedimentisphaerales bacterium]
MSIRVAILYLFTSFILFYAFKDWFVSLCGLIFLMSIIEYEDMPKNLLDIQGLNPWNVLFLAICLAWLVSRRRQGLTWDMPRNVNMLLLLYLGVILVGVLRALSSGGNMGWRGVSGLINDQLINSIKWVLPGILLFDGCRTRRQVLMALVCILAMQL